MKFKLDENLPVSSARSLAKSGHDVDTVAAEGLTGAADPDVVAAAAGEERVLITPDRGMGDIRAYPPGSHAETVVLRLTDQSAPAADDAITELANWAGLELVSRHGKTGLTARLAPFTADGLILARACSSSRPAGGASRYHHWHAGRLDAEIVAAIGANLAHGIGDGPIGALVSAWPALALAGSFELLMTPWRMAWDVRSATGLIPAAGEPERAVPKYLVRL